MWLVLTSLHKLIMTARIREFVVRHRALVIWGISPSQPLCHAPYPTKETRNKKLAIISKQRKKHYRSSKPRQNVMRMMYEDKTHYRNRPVSTCSSFCAKGSSFLALPSSSNRGGNSIVASESSESVDSSLLPRALSLYLSRFLPPCLSLFVSPVCSGTFSLSGVNSNS